MNDMTVFLEPLLMNDAILRRKDLLKITPNNTLVGLRPRYVLKRREVGVDPPHFKNFRNLVEHYSPCCEASNLPSRVRETIQEFLDSKNEGKIDQRAGRWVWDSHAGR